MARTAAPGCCASLRLVLASGSATRRALLAAAGLRFDVHVPDVDESAIKRQGGNVETAALRLAEAKARAAPGEVVIGADQILLCEGRWFDKPANLAEARQHLLALRGRTHELVTAAVCLQGREVVWRHVARPALTMRAFSDAFLDRYLEDEGEAVLSTVGAYRLEGFGIQLFGRVEGEHTTILGLPMLPLMAALRGLGVILG